MKKQFLSILFVLLLHSLSFGQIESDVILSNNTKEESIEISQRDLITPILQRSYFDQYGSTGILEPIRSRAGYSFIASALLPGLGQAADRNWVKAGVFTAIEAVSIYFAIEYHQRGVRGERNYERWADQNWSVVQYANWLVDYHDVHNIGNPFIESLRQMLNGASPAFNTSVDWSIVDLEILRLVERNTPFIVTDDLTANNFSHTLPDYGSQQYYELIAKYFQYQAGWRDYDEFHNSLGHTGDQFNQRFFIDRNGNYASDLFFDGALRAQIFNDNYRTGRHFKFLIITNHVFSAFDAYFTIKLKQNRFEATPSVLPGQQLNLSYRF